MFNISLGSTSSFWKPIERCLKFTACTAEKNTNIANCNILENFMTRVRKILLDQERIDFSLVSHRDGTLISLGLSTKSKRINGVIMNIIFLRACLKSF